MVGRRLSGRRPSPGGVPDGAAGARSAPTPKLNKDPVWSLKPWPVTVILGAREFTIPAMSAADWLAYLMQPTPDIDGLVLDYLSESEELIYTGVISVEELYESCLELISTVCAQPWWMALRQVHIARDSWHILGPKMLERVDLERISIAAFLDVLLVVTLESMDPKDTAMFVLRLETPPAEVAADQPPAIESMEMDRGSFLSMQ